MALALLLDQLADHAELLHAFEPIETWISTVVQGPAAPLTQAADDTLCAEFTDVFVADVSNLPASSSTEIKFVQDFAASPDGGTFSRALPCSQ